MKEKINNVKTWEVYSAKYNELSELMVKANIDTQLLVDLIKAATELYSN